MFLNTLIGLLLLLTLSWTTQQTARSRAMALSFYGREKAHCSKGKGALKLWINKGTIDCKMELGKWIKKASTDYIFQRRHLTVYIDKKQVH